MARSRGRSHEHGSGDDSNTSNGARRNGGPTDPTTGTPAPGTTGRYLVLLREDSVDAGVKALTENAGLTLSSTADNEAGMVDIEGMGSGEAIVFDKLAVAIVDMLPDQLQSLSIAVNEDSAILAIEPERVVYAIAEAAPAIDEVPLSGTFSEVLPRVTSAGSRSSVAMQYLLGYRDAVNHIVDHMLGGTDVQSSNGVIAAVDESSLTWGLQATRVAESRYSGRGVRVAILDTGIDLNHPDFAGRRIMTQSFVAGEEVQDGHGHGTHCIGTACGPRQGRQLPRYGVAYNAEIYAGKVLSNRGSGSDGGILAGINWAISNGCAVISMSLGAPTEVGQSFSAVYEAVARRALAAGTLIVAAAGNESRRPGQVNPVGHPANCPSIMAVAAIDAQLQIASFSCGGLNLQGGQVDIAGPGVAVRSTWPQPTLYRTISGTSMATPHVAGIAALLAEANPAVRGGALGWLLLQSARRLDLPAQDIGAGLVQAP